MDRKRYKQLRIVVAVFVGLIVSVAVSKDSYLLATAGVLTGIIFMILMRTKAKIRTDERELTIQEKAVRLTYAIFAPTIGITSFLLLLPSRGGFSVFSKGEWLYVESIGMVFAYLTLFLITLYAISYHFFDKLPRTKSPRYSGVNTPDKFDSTCSLHPRVKTLGFREYSNKKFGGGGNEE